MNVTALGEFGLIAALAKIAGRPAPGLVVGIGDDAAAWTPGTDQQLATTDILVEGIHFTLDSATWYDVGWKALAANISDIAAMGGVPRYALVSLALPTTTEVASVEELYRGAVALADRFGTVIAGGDTVRSPQAVVVAVVLLGDASLYQSRPRLLRRNAARPGDVVAVTGTLGGAAGGLELLLHGKTCDPGAAFALCQAHLRPIPRVPEAHVLLASGVEAAMDISDGITGDLRKLCEASGVAAVLEATQMPVHPALRTAFPDRALELALYGGEDYELLFCAPPAVFATTSAALHDAGLAPATAVGQIVAGPPSAVWLRGEDGSLVEPARGGYDAFAK
jgi:thiamine-monophosphate kinase